jgi:hypothetical protein
LSGRNVPRPTITSAAMIAPPIPPKKMSPSPAKPLFAILGILATFGWLFDTDYIPKYIPKDAYLAVKSPLRHLVATVNMVLLDARIKIVSYLATFLSLMSRIAKDVLPVGADSRIIYLSVPVAFGIVGLIYNKLVAKFVLAPVRLIRTSNAQPVTQWSITVNSKTLQTDRRLNSMISKAKRQRQQQAKDVLKFLKSVKRPDVSSAVMRKMVDVKAVFSRIDSEKVAEMITPKLFPVVDKILKDDVFVMRAAKRLPVVPRVYDAVLKARTQVVVRKVIDRVKEDPEQFLDFKSIIASELAMHQNMVDSLSRRCEMFILIGGLWSGAVIGASQLIAWLMLDPIWSVALIGAGFICPVRKLLIDVTIYVITHTQILLCKMQNAICNVSAFNADLI